MIREWLTDQGYLLGPAFALLLFLVVFTGMLVWLYRPGSTRVYEHEARLPLEDLTRPGGTAAPASEE